MLINHSSFLKTKCVKVAKSLKPSFTSGLDKVSSFLIKDCASVLAPPLTFIFNLAIKTGIFSNKWKETKVVLVHKSGDNNDVMNYRPIAIISNFAKFFEFSIKNQLNNSLASFVVEEQHGCIKKKSPITNRVSFFILSTVPYKKVSRWTL